MRRFPLQLLILLAVLIVPASPAVAGKRIAPANTIEGALERSPLRQGADSGPDAKAGGTAIEKRLAALFKSRGVTGLTPPMIRDLALAQLRTGTPAGVLASISEREFSHDSVRVAGSIPGTVSSGGYFSAFAFKPASWDYYKYALWGDDADRHSPFDYGDAAMVAGTILQHYRGNGNRAANHIKVDPLGALKDYNANYAAGVLKDADGKYGSSLWTQLIRKLSGLQRSGKLDAGKPTGISPEELLFRAIRMRVELFFSGIPQATG